MISEQVEIPTSDGTIDALFVRQEGAEPLPGVIQLTDGLGFRQAHADLSARIAGHGYAVLTPNIYYRSARPPAFPPDADFSDERTRSRFGELTAPLTPEAMTRDGSALVEFLSSRHEVRGGDMAVVGFCFTGQFALRIAAERSDRISAAASFHGGGLLTDTDRSPHLVLPGVRARLYFGHSDSDRTMTREVIARFEEALRSWGGAFESETYSNAAHGWMIPGGRPHNPDQAERGFLKLMEMLDGTLRVRVS